MKRMVVLFLVAIAVVVGVICVKTVITPVASDESISSSFTAEQVTPAASSTQSNDSATRFYDDSSSPCGTGITTNRLVIPELTDDEIADEVGQLNEGYGYDVIYEEATEALVVIPTEDRLIDESTDGEDDEEDIGPAIWVNPETDCYETSDGATWPKEEEVDKSATDEPVVDDEGPIVDGDPRTDEGPIVDGDPRTDEGLPPVL